MNIITIHGRLTKDPETRAAGSTTVTSFSVAVDRNYQKPGEEKKTDFFNCQCWAKRGDVIAKRFTKGKEIMLTGEMQNNRYTDKDGNKRDFWQLNVSDFDFCGGKSDGNVAAGTPPVASMADFEEVLTEDGVPF